MSSVHIAVPGTRSDSLYEGFPTVHGTCLAHAYTHVHTLVYMHSGVHDLSSSMRHGTIGRPLRAWRFEKSTMYVPARRATRPAVGPRRYGSTLMSVVDTQVVFLHGGGQTRHTWDKACSSLASATRAERRMGLRLRRLPTAKADGA